MLRRQQTAKFKMTAKQKEIFNQLTTAQQLRLLQVLELKQYQKGSKRIRPSNRTKAKPIIQDDSQDIVNQYQDRLI
ncbi:MAG: hypothetical protein RMY16_30180 [Nostoc sp. DedQUE12b]|uniref:hypothetical protein n=1 Tax=Nostoc sp. DedQUE12b TaxID=3075398 RepID=UPI002AD3D1D3|nr:hypothetical protein [Nostoc sp. DedQUE12b]MDZ8089790.1 hypothetical protein [Nostoc sp. DedQUE12b]